jgi:hypothetical protein
MEFSEQSAAVASAAATSKAEERQVKKSKPNHDTTNLPETAPSSIISVFMSEAGDRAGPPVDLPTTTTAKQLQQLVNSLLNNDDKVRI